MATRTGPVVLGVRPHDLALDRTLDGEPRGVVSLVEPLGSEQIVYVSVPGGQDLVAAVDGDTAPRVDEPVVLRIPPTALHFFDPQSGERLPLGA
jgi:ABC-type sugar transport system ATPase subunit